MGTTQLKKMKIFKFLSLAVSVAVAQYNPNPVDPGPDPVIPDGISCFHCDAANMTHCMDIGEMKACPENAQSCMVEARKRGGELESICMGCKSPVACNDNKKQNFKGKWAARQCKPWNWASLGASVCRQCCNTDGCELELGNTMPTQPADW